MCVCKKGERKEGKEREGIREEGRKKVERERERERDLLKPLSITFISCVSE